MRISYPILHGLISGLLVVACGKTDDLTATAGETESSGGSSGSTGDVDPTTGASNASDNTTGESCVPGASVACACTDGGEGAQVCAADGKSFGDCVCEGGSESNSNSDATTSPTSDPTTTGVDDTTTGDDTTGDDTTTGDTTTGDDTTGSPACEDPGPEPNEEEAEAVEFPEQTCQAEDATLEGVLDGENDVDWFTYHGADGQGCGFENPFVQHSLTASDDIRLCVFIECDDGEADVMCSDGLQEEDSPGGRPGCCGMGDVTYQFNCSGSPNESVNIFVRLDQAPADACVDYSVVYGFGPNN